MRGLIKYYERPHEFLDDTGSSLLHLRLIELAPDSDPTS